MATAMKVMVAAMDLKENRAIPAIPWPEVHPLANVTPIPTRNPPMAETIGGYQQLVMCGVNIVFGVVWLVRTRGRIGGTGIT